METARPCNALHLVKLCVGADSIEDLEEWQALVCSRRREAGLDPNPRHVTRMWPRRQAELLPGGSLYWVIRGLILVRQPIIALEEVTGEDGIVRCGIVLDQSLHRTEARPRGPFQGWRYLSGTDAPRDLTGAAAHGGMAEGDLPADLQQALSELGVRTARG
jgi:hypothetical protein